MRNLALPTLLGLLLAAPGSTEEVLVLLRDPTGSLRAAPAEDPARELRRRRSLAAEARRQLLADLGPGLARAARPLWVANAVVLDLDAEAQARVAARPDVAAIEANDTIQRTPVPVTDPPGDDPEATWGLRAIGALAARERHGVDGSGVVVGILDSGIDASHPDLAGKVIAWKDHVGEGAEPYDESGHGTHVAGTISGGAASGRAVGVAPGVKLVVGRILGGIGVGTAEDILAGMQWVVDPDGVPGSGDEPRLVSNSWGSVYPRESFRRAIQTWRALDILPVFAAGNSGPRRWSMGFPAGYPEALAVGASDVTGAITEFSSRGPVRVDAATLAKPDLTGPGAAVLSSMPGGAYDTKSGTSMACPHVAGVAALLFQARPEWSAAEVERALLATVRDRGEAGRDLAWGAGFLDAEAALGVAVAGGKLRVRVLDESGAALPWARVWLDGEEHPRARSATGEVEARLPPGAYGLRVEAFGYQARELTGVEVMSGELRELAVTLALRPHGTVRISASGAGGAAVPFEVRIDGADRPAVAATSPVELRLPAGTHDLVVDALGHEATRLEDVAVAAGQVLEREVALSALPAVLLVDDDRGRALEPWFQAALEDAGEAYRMQEHPGRDATVAASVLADHEVVVWFTGSDAVDPLNRDDEDALGAYLADGGRLLISGQDIGHKLEGTPFLELVLGARLVADGTNSKTVEGAGLSLALKGGDGAGNQWTTDVLEPSGGAETFLRYGDGRAAAVLRATGPGRVTYLAFGLEGVSTAEDRQALLERCLETLRGPRR